MIAFEKNGIYTSKNISILQMQKKKTSILSFDYFASEIINKNKMHILFKTLKLKHTHFKTRNRGVITMRYSNIVEISGYDIFKQRGIRRTFSAGQQIAERGQPATRVFFIKSGQVRAFFSDENGNELTLFYINAGNMFCTESLVSHPTIIVSLDALVDAEVYALEPDVFLKSWFDTGHSVQELLSHFVRRILLLSDYLCCTRFPKNESRLAYFLYSMYMDCPSSILYTHEQISNMIGISKVSVDRILRKLEDEGAVALRYRKIDVLHPELLVHYFKSKGFPID